MKTIRPNHTGDKVIISYKKKEEKEKNIISINKGDIVDIDDAQITFIVDNVTKKDEQYIFINTTGNIITAEKQEIKDKQATIENLMNDLLPKPKKEEKEEKEEKTENNEKNITFEITLTKRQKEVFDQKGGVSWLKKCIDNNVSVKKKGKKKKLPKQSC